MPSSAMLRCVALARTDVSEKHIASIIRVTGIGELETPLAVTINRNVCSYKSHTALHSRRRNSSEYFPFIFMVEEPETAGGWFLAQGVSFRSFSIVISLPYILHIRDNRTLRLNRNDLATEK
jgi:hypothetical protein